MKSKHIRHALGVLFILAFILSVVGIEDVPVAHAATFNVNSTADAVDANPGNGTCATAGGVCTLRAAIQEANALPGNDIINLPAGTYTLTIAGANEDSGATGDLDIVSPDTGTLTILGAGAATTIIDGGGLDRVFHVIGRTFEIRDITIQGGSVSGSGGGIFNDVGNVTVRSSRIRNNTASINGGGIYNRFGTVNVLQNSVIGGSGTPNTAAAGGGIFTQYSSSTGTNLAVIDQSEVSFNVASTGNGGGIHASDDGDLTITNSTIQNNQANAGVGGGVFSTNTVIAASTTFTMTGTNVLNNTAGGGAGVALQNISNATISGSTFTNNDTVGVDGGGGIYYVTSAAGTATLNVTSTSITGSNASGLGGGGGIRNLVGGAGSTGSIIISGSIISNNEATGSGGGINNSANGVITISTSTIANNATDGVSGGGGINNAGALTINESTISGNQARFTAAPGGGITHSGATATLTINTSTISGNSADGSGGGIAAFSASTVTTTNSTISGNTANTDGGGISNNQTTVNLNSVTIANNTAATGSGGGVFNSTDATSIINFTNTIIATNVVGTSGPDCLSVAPASMVSGNYNLIGSFNAATCVLSGTTTNNIVNPPGGAGLTALANNGGPTQTHRLQSNSPAIDVGNCPSLTADQRGLTRPVDIASIPNGTGNACDMGAFEVQSLTNATIGDRVWNDTNANGIQDLGEVGIANVAVELLDSTGLPLSPPQTTTTNASGLYSFSAAAGTYIVHFTPPAGFTFSPQNQGSDDSVDSDADINTGRAGPFIVNGGDTVDIWDAGMFQAATIGDRVWIDSDGDGIQDAGETNSVAGVIVNLFDTGNNLRGSTGTNASGIYSLTNVTPGTYYLEFVLPVGYQFSLQDQGGDDNTDSDANPTTGRTANFTIGANETQNQWDAGVIQLAGISDFVWNDLDGDGIQDTGEPGLQNVTVTLLNGAGNPLVPPQSDITDANGLYGFTVTPGTYIVQFTLPVGFVFSPQDVGGDDSVDSDANPTTGRTAQIVLSSGTILTNVDAGMFQPATIGNFVWQDTNANGIQDGGEPGLLNATVNLRDSTGTTVLQTVTTPASGAYSFTAPAGTYIIEVIPPANTPPFAFSAPDQGGNDALDSDFNQATGRTAQITLVAGATNNDVDAGLHLSASVTGFVWDDTNGNGAQEGGEPGRDGVTVRLYDTTGTTIIASTTTSGGGNYTLNNIPAGPTILEVVPPPGTSFSPQDATVPPDDTIDSDVNQVTGRLNLNLAPQGTIDIDAGLVTGVAIGDFVWTDTNGDGLQTGETGLNGITVNLYASNGTTLLGSTVTAGGGLYSFFVTPGSYVIEVVLPATGFSFSPQDVGANDAIDSDVNPTNGRVSVTITTANNTIDAGLVQTVSVTGFVWDDTNTNGVQEGGEPGRDGVTVNLRNGAGTVVLFTTTTSGGGNYSFLNIPAGSYILEVVAPAGFGFTVQDGGVPQNDAIDSDVNQFTGRLALNLAPGAAVDFDAGLVPAVIIGDFVWVDANENDVQDVGEVGLDGVTVNLRNAAGTTILNTVVTSGGGLYSFTVPAGSYVIEVVRPTGYNFADPDIGGNDALDSDVGIADGRVAVTVTANDNTIDAGLQPTATIGDFVWNDANVNGIQDAGELGIQGVTVNLLDSAGLPLVPPQTTTTNATGNYSFSNLLAGNYIVEFVTPAGRSSTQQDIGSDATDSDIPAFQTGALRTGQVTVLAGTPNLDVDAGFFQSTSLGDFIWNDANGNGIQDGGETGLNNVALTLTWAGPDGNFLTAGDNLTFNATTNATGNYTFANLPAGNYQLQVTAPPGMVFTLQNAGTDDNVDSDADATGLVDNITLVAGTPVTNVDVGLFVPAGVTGFVWNDLNLNGIQEPGEPGLVGIDVELRDAAGTVVQATVATNGAGIYTFANAAPGNHRIRFIAPAGYVFSPQDAVTDDTIDSDADPATGLTAVFNVPTGGTVGDIDAGMLLPATVGNFVWVDLDGDGIQDTGEPGWNGVTVRLLNSAGTAILFTTITANDGTSDGRYTFTVPAGDYILEVVAPTNFSFTLQDQGVVDSIDSDVDPTTGRVTLPTLAPGDVQLIWDAGIIQTVIQSLNITKTSVDLSPAPGLVPGDRVGWIICVLNPNATPATNVVITDNVDTASQTLVVTTPANQNIRFGVGTACPSTTPVAGDFNIVAQTFVPNTNNISVTIPTLGPGQVGILYFEVTLNDPGSSFLPPTSPETRTNAGVMRMSTLLLAIGGWLLANRRRWWVAALVMAVLVVMLGPLHGLYAQDSGDRDTPGNAQTGGRWVRYEASAPGIQLTGDWQSVDFTPASGRRYMLSDDINAALTLRFGGTKVRVYYVSLWDSAVASLSVDNQLLATLDAYSVDSTPRIVMTDEFVLGAGSHTLHLQSTGRAANPNATIPVLAIDAIDVWVPDPAANDDGSNPVSSTISGIVWYDTNRDGKLDPGDWLLEGVTVFLYLDNGANDILLTSDVTDEDGRYMFTNLAPANYWVIVDRETLPDGIDRRSINWIPVDVEAPFEGDLIIPSRPGTTVYSFLRGRAWLDKDQNGAVSSGDTPAAAVPVLLYSDDGDRVFDPSENGDFVVNTQTTDSSGHYAFSDLLPGVYWIVVDTENLPDTADQEQTWNLLWVRVPKVSQVDLLLIAAPERFRLGGTAWLDMNRNNKLDSADAILPGLTITLHRDNGNNSFDQGADTLVNTVLTGENGRYAFDRLVPGIYWIIPDMNTLPPAALRPQVWPPFWVRVPVVDNAELLLIPAPPGQDVEYPTGPGTVFGTVFNDDNGNRNWDTGRESGISNIQMSLYYDNGDGEFGGDMEIGIVQTDANGRYEFKGLGNGAFWLKINAGTLPENYMDTVAYGNHGVQNVQQLIIDSAAGTNETVAVLIQGPEFAYALDTDHDGSPDGREGSGDRDNDNVPNHLDAFDPSGIVFAVDPFGQTLPLANVQIALVYEKDGEWVPADTIQPNPQYTGPKGDYRFDLNVTADDGNGIPQSGSRTFRLEVSELPADHSFPSSVYEPAGTFVGASSGSQVMPFSVVPVLGSTAAESGASNFNYYLEFSLERGDADFVNNHIPIDRPEIILNPAANNTACVNWTENQGTPPCATGQVVLQTNADFTLVAGTPQNATLEPGQTITPAYQHTLTNIGDQSDRYRIAFPAGTQGWVQTLTIRDGATNNVLATLQPGQTFDTTTPLPPNGTLLLQHSITVALGAADGTVDTTTISATSLEALAAGATLTRSTNNVTTVNSGCISGTVYNDLNSNGAFNVGEGLNNVRLFILQGTTPFTEVRTNTNGAYRIDLPSGTYTVQLDPGTLPPGVPVFVDPVSGQRDNIVVNATTDTACRPADFRLNILAPAISKFASVAQAVPGDTVVFTITVNNPTTSGPLTSITITDQLPAFLTLVTATASAEGPGGVPVALAATISPGPPVTVTFNPGTTFVLEPGRNINISITTTVDATVPRPFTMSNQAVLRFGTSGSQTSLPAVVQIPAETASGGNSGSGGGSGGSSGTDEEDLGTGGPVVGFGQEGTSGADTLPTTGYWPAGWHDTAQAVTTTKLSTEGRIFVGLLAVLSILAGFGLYYLYNNSERLYQWLHQKPRWLDRSFIGVVVLLFAVGVVGLIYAVNDMLGVVDVDSIVGLKGKPLPREIDQLVSTEDGDNRPDGIDNSGNLPTVPLPRPDTDTRRVIIPSLNLLTKLVEAPIKGTTWDVSVFFDELAHLEGTAVPGTSGNTVIAGHVTHTRGLGPFRNLDTIQPGAYVIVKDYDVEYTYVVTEIFEVSPKAIEVTYNTDEAMLTLISCADWNPNRRVYNKRIVVRAMLYQWRILSGEASETYMQELGSLTRHEVGYSEALQTTGTWEEINSYYVSETSYFYSADKDAELSLRFIGDKFRLHYVMFNNFGIFDVYLDNKLVMTIDGYSPYSGFVTTDVFQIEPGRHTLRIVNTGEANRQSKGNVIGLDAIDVWQR